ncbi:MAG: hybrid sensor histidine kinase/response regulator [Rhodanobacter sp.]|nr:MAG: hybrid sensor histidine kinase/response regulator [Rhodanobacter sp.]TAM04596.1 MAG: hybrid sensor histidine kinase/response regulator [Rhodanobacter sp.]TAM39298.1 MAG: hybrid sensor histidine kinase/response regulator [Rhodanobacter sp.]TAN28711.1 MAG: hybrid sensor histidine kinase/response regulator [Rhodanobacter sp.]
MLAALVLNAVLALAAPASSAGAASAAGSVVVTAAEAAGIPATPQFLHYGVADGVPSGSIYAVAQDRLGLMWFGADGGLVRFDGIAFKVFRHVSGDPLSLPNNQIYALFVDRGNRIWAGGISGGLTVYDQASGRFRNWQHDAANSRSLSNNEVWSIAQTPDGQIWVATQTGLDRMRDDGRGFDQLPLDVEAAHAASFGPTRALLAGSDGRLWIGAESGLYVRSLDGTIRRVPVDPAFHGDIGAVWRIDGGPHEIRVAVSGGLLIIGADGVARPLANQQLANTRILGSVRDNQGRLWLGSLDGVWLAAGREPLQHIVGEPLLPGGLPSDRLWQLFRDREGGLWFTFDQSSIGYLPPGWNGFARFTHVPDHPDSLSNTAALSVLRGRRGTLWVGGYNGWVDRLDPLTGEVTHVIEGLNGHLTSLAEDARGRLWITGPGKLFRYDHGKLLSLGPEQTHAKRPIFVVAGVDGLIYLASWGGGPFAIDPDTLASTPLLPRDAPDNCRFPDQLRAHDGAIWYANVVGLMRSEGHGQPLAFVPGVPRREIYSFAFDADGFWIATEQALEHYRYASGQATRDDSVDISGMDLIADLRTMLVDHDQHLWLFSSPGLRRFDPRTHRFTPFGPAQGLSNAEFSNGSTAVAASGVVLAASSGGVMAFQPSQLAKLDEPGPRPLLSITRISVRRGRKAISLPLNEPVQLRWRDSDLRVEARIASYVDPAANHYYYHMLGFDPGWIDAGAQGRREFVGLGAGSYTLEVHGHGADGQWGKAVPLSIHVQAPPWTRWWAWLLYVLLVAALAGLLLHAWRRRLAQRHQIQLAEQQRQMAEAASAAKTQFLATLSHEIRTPMTGVMGMAELLLSTPLNPLQHDYTRAMQRSGGMLLKLLNDALDLARIEAGRLELEPTPFNPRQLLEEVAQLEQGLAHARGIHFVLELADDLPTQVVGDAVRIKQVLLNLANNALKFTEQGHVELRAICTGDGLLFSVSDTGPGIPEASQARLFQRFEQVDGPQRRAGSGLGLAICRELVDRMGGGVELESRVGYGSTFRVRLPLVEPAAADVVPSASQADNHRLLLVEDDTIVAAVMRGLLEREGHSLVHVENGLAVLAELAHASFDAVLLDLDLPGVDGFQIARLIRQREFAGERLPIIAVTARSGGRDEKRAHEAGMDGFLRKPISGEQLVATLARVIGVSTAMPPA